MKEFLHFKSIYPLAVIFFAAFLVILPNLLHGYPSGTIDLIHHIQLSLAYSDALGQGSFVPNWVSNENFSFGSVAVRFYPPLKHFSMAFFYQFSGNWGTAFTASIFFWSVIGGIGTYIFAFEIFQNRRQATIAAFIFTLGHYRVNQVYNAFLFAEFVALSILPFTLFFAVRVCERRKLADICGFAVSISLLILSNVPQTVIGAIIVGIFVLFHLKKEVFLKQAGGLAAGCALGLLGSSFYWLRMLGEMKDLNVYQPNTDPNYDFRNHFLLMRYEFDEQGVWFVSSMFVALALYLIIIFAVSGNVKAILRNRRLKGLAVIFAVGTLLMLVISQPVWENLTFLQRVQFPWRFLAVTSFCGAIFAAHCFGIITRENWSAKRPLILILVGITFIYCFASIRQVGMGARFIDESQFTQMFADSRTAEGLEHWRTTWMSKKAFENQELFFADGRNYEIKLWENEIRQISVSEGEKSKARIGTFFYQHWQATVNGEKVSIEKDENGAMLINLPAEQSEIELKFVEPQISLISRKISIAVWLSCFLVFIYGWFRKPENL